MRLTLISLCSVMRATTRALSTTTQKKKDLWIIRHGQATHNPRAEAAKDRGCSFEEFFDWMRKDDSLDSPLTELGRKQAETVNSNFGSMLRNVDLVVSSPLSRALETADLAVPFPANRVCYEQMREINGVLENAKRRDSHQLIRLFPRWDFDNIPPNDETWDEAELESRMSCAERGYQGFRWIFDKRKEQSVALVAHGGILKYAMEEHPLVVLEDLRTTKVDRGIEDRFGNCEVRRYMLQVDGADRVLLSEVDLDCNSSSDHQ